MNDITLYGRNSYEDKVEPYLDQIEKMYMDGYGRKKIADNLGISVSLYTKYLKIHKDLALVENSGTENIVEKLRASVIKEATGYETAEETTMYDADGNVIAKKVKTYFKPGNARLLEFLLTNFERDTFSKDGKQDDDGAILIELSPEAMEYSE